MANPPIETDEDDAAESVDPAELLLQAIGIADAGEEDWVDAGAALDPDELSEIDLTLMDLSSDLAEESDDNLDPDLLALMERARIQPGDLDLDDDDPLGDLRLQEDDLDVLLTAANDPLTDEMETPPVFPGVTAKPLPDQPWFLGLDIGTTGISAVLCNRQTRTLYPLYWLEIKFPDPIPGSLPIPQKTFRLPASVYLSPVAGAMPGAAAGVAIASLSLSPSDLTNPAQHPIRNFKPYLRLGVPYYTTHTPHWEPILQWTDAREVPLSGLHQGLRALLASLNTPILDPQVDSDAPLLSLGATGLEDAMLQEALQNLAAVVVSQPSNWSDTYGFNVREAVLAARLVAEPEQVILVDEAIATLLASLEPPDEQALTLPSALTPPPALFQVPQDGTVLVVNGGASLTELAIAPLSTPLQPLAYDSLTTRSVAYGGLALEQDIICQLIYPAWIRQAHRSNASSPADSPFRPCGSVDWQDPWATLGWENLVLPVVGDPDLANRHYVQQRLLSAPAGLALLEAARHLKLALQEGDRAALQLGEWVVWINRQDFGSRVLLPYIQRLNRELNALLSQSGHQPLNINQVICSGGTASLGAIARWLRQKLPNATLHQDSYPAPDSTLQSHVAGCSRVAYGLATLPFYPQAVNVPRHQYNDYFLLMELLRTFPDGPLTLASLLQTLERRGINVQRCQPNILALLSGRLPPGLVPLERDAHALTADSRHNPDYQALINAPLFLQDDPQTYRPNPELWQRMRQYLDTLLSSSYQKLSEPLPFTLESILAPKPS